MNGAVQHIFSEGCGLQPAQLHCNECGFSRCNVVANGSSHAFLYIGGRSIDLNDLVAPSLPLLTSAAGISNNGKIVASGLNGHLYVLTPK
jgi:hypothetical protein